MRALKIITVLCVSVIAVESAWGQWEQVHKLIAHDAAEGDLFGFSVAINDDVAVVGSIHAGDGVVDYCGAAYILDLTSGEQIGKLTADDAAPSDCFGKSVAIGNGVVLVGAFTDDSPGGSAYVFDLDSGEQLHRLVAEDAMNQDHFGSSVAIHGDTAIIGAPWNDDPFEHAGAAYLFDLTSGEQLHKLTAPDAAEKDDFGYSVAINGSFAVVGAWADDAAGTKSGSAYVFDATTGAYLRKLTADDATANDFFGCAVAIGQDILAVIGASGHEGAGYMAGSAYVFDVTTGQQVHQLAAHDAVEEQRFGTSIALDGDLVLVGAPEHAPDDPYDPGGTGMAYLFDIETGEELAKLTAADESQGDRFGIAVNLHGDMCIVGALGDDDVCPEDPFCNSGAAYVFEESSASCPADITGDGVVDVLDLLEVLAQWGGTGSADITGDGVVDVLDLLEVLAAWGPCP